MKFDILIILLALLFAMHVLSDKENLGITEPPVEEPRCRVDNVNFPATAEECKRIHDAIDRRLKHEHDAD